MSAYLCGTFALCGLLAGVLLAGSDKEPTPKDRLLPRFMEELVTLTPGKGDFPASFEMGAAAGPEEEQPAHTVTLRRSFRMAKYEMTQELYQFIMDSEPSRWKGPRNSVELVSWDQAVAFCARLTSELRKQKQLTDDETVRLPTEAEWEYACRAGSKTAYSFGSKDADLKDFAWFKGNAAGNDPPVGKLKPNAWGLYDMHGYVWEWCLDAWHPSYKDAPTDGTAWDTKDAAERVLRGGAWTESAERCRSTARHHAKPDLRSDAVGFRCVVEKGARDEHK
jgi:formylglycine-generating enzyme required for sulfatase activity